MTTLPPETDWDQAPSIVDGAMELELSAEKCNLDYWFEAVAQGTLAGLVRGHRPQATVPDYMLAPGPLRDSLITEMGFRSVAEEKATRAISSLVENAPDLACMEFYATQLIDEARHARVFRGHIVELGVPEAELAATIEAYAGKDIEAVILPLEEFAQPIRDARDFIGGVILLTVLVEGLLAPAADLSERKWRRLNPAVADIERGAGIDELRHLTVGSDIVRRHLLAHPEDMERLTDLIVRGQQMWLSVPIQEVLFRRETLFQQGLEMHRDLIGDYEVWPGVRLADTTPESRIAQSVNWSMQMQQSRLAYMGF
jgi:hypothetical protein